MHTITIQAKAGKHNAKNHRILNGVEASGRADDFVEYFDAARPMHKKLKPGAYMHFVLVDDELKVRVKYRLNEKLTSEEIEELKRYTQGQWSDGIGEGFEQFPCKEENGKEIFLSPWYRGQAVEAIEGIK